MKVTLMGKKAIDFTAADGRAIKGSNIYVAFPEDKTEGLMTEKHFIHADKVDDKVLVVGTDIDLVFNSRGKIEAVLKI